MLGWVIRIVTWCVIHQFDSHSAALLESELAAHIDKVIDNDSNIAICLDYGIREVEKYRGGRITTLAVEIRTGIYYQPIRVGVTGLEVYDRAITAGAIDLNADRVGTNRQTGDADDLHATTGLQGVIAHRIICIRRLEQRQAELEVAQYQSHSTIRCRGVAAVDDPVAIAVDPVRSADTNKAVHIRSTYLEHGYILG